MSTGEPAAASPPPNAAAPPAAAPPEAREHETRETDMSVIIARRAYLESCRELKQAIGGLEEAMITFTGGLRSSAARVAFIEISLSTSM